MRLRTLLWPTLLACTASCGRIDFDAQPGTDGGPPPIIDAALTDTAEPPIDTPPIDPDKLWWDPAWSHRVRVSFSTAELEQLADFEALIDIPLALRIDDIGLDPALVQLGGGDIRFVASDNVTELAYEIERRPTGGGDAVIATGTVLWVKVPSIRKGDLRNYVWLYYGNPEAVDAQKPADVWSSDYLSVWHLGEPEGARTDSTSNGHHLLGEGQLGTAQDGDLLLGDSVTLTPNDPKPLQHPPLVEPGTSEIVAFTVEAFIRPDSNETDMMIAASSDGDVARSFELTRIAATESIEFSLSLDCTSMVTAVHDADPVDVARWHHIVASYDGDMMRIYHNGFLVREHYVLTPAVYPVCVSEAPFQLGALDGNVRRFTGRVDEVRISGRAQASPWILAQYFSARRPDKLIVYGAHELRP